MFSIFKSCVVILLCPYFRFQVAIKTPHDPRSCEAYHFLEEAKSMFEIGKYHENIVNLQGITYGKKDEKGYLPEVCFSKFFFILSIIAESLFKQNAYLPKN